MLPGAIARRPSGGPSPNREGRGVSSVVVGKGFWSSAHHRCKASGALLRTGLGGDFPMPKPLGRVPLPKERCSWERGKAAPRFGVPPALLWSREGGSVPQTAGLKSWRGPNPLEGEKAGMGGKGKILVKGRGVCKPLSAPGIGVAAAALTCRTPPAGVKPASPPCPQTMSWGLHPRRGRDTRGAAGWPRGCAGGCRGAASPRGARPRRSGGG